VTMYDPTELAKTHGPGRHQYLLAREVFEVDVVINMPKLKTHCKSGLTGALKNLVGINGSKDYLPHHRFGGSDIGGDCYDGLEWWKHALEIYYDDANRCIGQPTYDVWMARLRKLQDLYSRFFDINLEGAWYGNDTCWRMNLDLNCCLLYGDRDGHLHSSPQRRVVHLTDALVAGHGEGPLAPLPLGLGIITYSESAVASDWAHSALLRFDAEKLALLRGCFAASAYPLIQPGQMPEYVTRNGKTSYGQLARDYGLPAEPPRGWKEHCELRL
jgi:hypothetical protein